MLLPNALPAHNLTRVAPAHRATRKQHESHAHRERPDSSQQDACGAVARRQNPGRNRLLGTRHRPLSGMALVGYLISSTRTGCRYWAAPS